MLDQEALDAVHVASHGGGRLVPDAWQCRDMANAPAEQLFELLLDQPVMLRSRSASEQLSKALDWPADASLALSMT